MGLTSDSVCRVWEGMVTLEAGLGVVVRGGVWPVSKEGWTVDNPGGCVFS